MVERLLEDPEDVLHFDDKTLISNYRLLHEITVSTCTATTTSIKALSVPRGKWWNRHSAAAFSRRGEALLRLCFFLRRCWRRRLGGDVTIVTNNKSHLYFLN